MEQEKALGTNAPVTTKVQQMSEIEKEEFEITKQQLHCCFSLLNRIQICLL